MTKRKTQAKPSRPLAAVILAAGKGTRLKNRRPKALQPILARPMAAYAIAACRALKPVEVRLVIGHGAAAMKAAFGDSVAYTTQRRQKGTGHALLQCRGAYKAFAGDLLVSTADQPRMTAETFARLVAEHRRTGAAATILTNTPADPFGYGRIRRGKNGNVLGVVEERDCTAAQRKIREVNVCAYVFRAEDLFPALARVGSHNAQGEQYLTDVIGILAKSKKTLATVPAAFPEETDQVSDQADLARMTAAMRDEINAAHMANGVTIVDPPSTFIGPDVTIGADTIVYPRTQIEGTTRIGKGAVLGPNSFIADADIGAGARVIMSYLTGCVCKARVQIGPFAHIRPESVIGRDARVGNFVEVKKSHLADGVKASHLSYLGDATIGRDTNIGAGTITANFDGVRKNETHIGANGKVGSGTIFVAPVTVGDGVITGAGAVVTRDQHVPDDATVVGMPAKALKKKTPRRTRAQRTTSGNGQHTRTGHKKKTTSRTRTKTKKRTRA